MKTFAERIKDLRKEITASIVRILANNNLQELEIPEEIEEPTYVVYFGDHGEGYDCPVKKVCIEDGALSLLVEFDEDGEGVIYASDLGCRNLDWLNGIRENILSTLELTYKRICYECGKPMDEGYCIDSGREYFCSDECLHKRYTPEEWAEMCGQGKTESYWTKWEDSNRWQDEP